MITATFRHGGGAGIAHAEAFTGDATKVRFPCRGAVQNSIADDDVFHRVTAEFRLRLDDNAPATQSLANIVIGLAGQFKGYSMRKKRTKTLPCGAGEFDRDCVVRQPFIAESPRYFA